MKIPFKLSAAAFIVAAVVSAPAGAVSSSWNTAGYNFGPSSAIYCNTSGTCQTTAATGAGWITLTAYSTPTSTYNSVTPTSTTAATPLGVTGNWVAAQIAMYSGGGIGITNALQTNTSAPDGVSPQHAIDNSGVYDILVVDFGAGNTATNFESLSMGWMCTINGATTCGTTANINVDAFMANTVGNPTTTNLASDSFGSATTLNGFASYSAITWAAATPDPGTGTLRTDNPAVPVPDDAGRYLIITPGLGATTANGGTTAFKISNITAAVAAPDTGHVPVPGSLPLVGLGLLALGLGRKRGT